MTEQLKLFGPTQSAGDMPAPIARRTDPETSQEAAAAIEPELTRIQQAVLIAAKDIGKPSTANEIAEWCQATSSVEANIETLRKRVRELERKEMLKECEPRQCRVTGKKAATFVVT